MLPVYDRAVPVTRAVCGPAVLILETKCYKYTNVTATGLPNTWSASSGNAAPPRI